MIISEYRAHRISVPAWAILFSLTALAASLHAQKQYPGLAQSEETTTEVHGKIVSFSPQNGTLVIDTGDGKQLSLTTDQRTEILSPPDPGADVEVTYAEVDGKNVARTVVDPAFFLENEHPTDRIHLMPLVLLALIVVVIAVVLQQWRARRKRRT